MKIIFNASLNIFHLNKNTKIPNADTKRTRLAIKRTYFTLTILRCASFIDFTDSATYL